MTKRALNGANRSSLGHRPRRRRLAPEIRRSELLNAALQVFKEVEPERVRVEDITRAAGAAKGTFYLYFPSWEDLLAAVRDHIALSYAAETRARLAAAPTVDWSVIENECLHFIDLIVANSKLHEVMFHRPGMELSISDEGVTDAVIVEMIAAGIATGACRPINANLAAPLVFSVLHETATSISRTGDREAKINAALELLRAWLRSNDKT